VTKILIQQQLDKRYRIWVEGETAYKEADWDLVAYSEAECLRAKRFAETKDYLAIEELESLYVKDNLIKEGKYDQTR
jgi:hypothetical protein